MLVNLTKNSFIIYDFEDGKTHFRGPLSLSSRPYCDWVHKPQQLRNRYARIFRLKDYNVIIQPYKTFASSFF